MNHLPSFIFAFDLDGVIIDSEPIKIAAFDEAVCRGYDLTPGQRTAISEYNRANRGIPRDTKFAYLLREIIGAPESDAPIIASHYRSLLEQRLPASPLIPGVREFVRGAEAPLFIASSAPTEEIWAHLRRHQLALCFRDVFGHPTAKDQALRTLHDGPEASPVVFFGDAPADLAAAQAAGVGFVAVNPNEALALLVPRFLPDFSDAARVLEFASETVQI